MICNLFCHCFAGCIQRTEYLPAASGPYCIPGGAAGQPYFGGQPIARPEPGTSSMVPLNSGPQMNPMGMVSMNGERMGPVMGVAGVAQQQSAGATTGKKGNNKRYAGLFMFFQAKEEKNMPCIFVLFLRSQVDY